MSIGLFVFDTAIGPCGLAWNPRGVVGAALPELTTEATLARLRRRHPEGEVVAEPPAHITRAADAIVALTEGQPADLTLVELDWTGANALEQQVWTLTRAIPPGETLTYGDIARTLGDLALSRSVGQALGANPIPIIVPCHRVVAAEGKTGGFSAPGGVSTKLKLLNIERARTSAQPTLFGDLPLEVRKG